MTEIRLSTRAAVALFLLPQACLLAALSVLLLDGRDRAAPFIEYRKAQAEPLPTVPLAPPALPPAPPMPAPATPPAETIPMARLLDFLLTARQPHATPVSPQPPSETRTALGTRLRSEIVEALTPLDTLEHPDTEFSQPSARLDEIRALIGDLNALQASFSSLRGAGAGRGTANGGLGGASQALAQILPLLDTIQDLREGRLGDDPARLENLDRFLGRDEERPRRLGLLLLLAWALDTPAEGA